MAQPKTIGFDQIHSAIDRLATAISDRHRSTSRLLLLGIANGGIELARRLATRLSELRSPSSELQSPNSNLRTPISDLRVCSGTLDISFHRDDIGRNPIPKEFAPTHIPSDVNGATVILVDDVLFSGRTVKAALDELFDHGRPAKVELAILVDRGGRRLPLTADYCGLRAEAGENEKVLVRLDPANPANDIIRIEPTGRNARLAAL